MAEGSCCPPEAGALRSACGGEEAQSRAQRAVSLGAGFEAPQLLSCKPATGTDRYAGAGTFEQTAEGHNVYVNDGNGASSGVIQIQDIFGCVPSGQYKRICDLLADKGFAVASPDIFGPHAWPEDKFPPPDMNEFNQWLGSTASFEKISASVESARKHLESKYGVQKFALIGHCLGAARSMQQATDGKYNCVAACHPAEMLCTNEVCQNCPVPVALLLSKDESDMTEQRSVLKDGSEVFANEFRSQVHGFMAARADFTDEQQLNKAKEGVDVVTEFFKKHL